MRKFAVVLSGCGVFDGAEIHEATLTLWAIKKHGADYQVFAPDIPQHHVINHLTGQEMPETRNVLVESARIARGNIRDLKEFNPGEFDALIFPGGFGAAKNLCDFAFRGEACDVNKDVEQTIRKMASLGKPIGALCISPVILARVLGNVEVTIGQDTGTAAAVEKMGARHKKTGHGDVVTDLQRKVFTTPCYMLDADILQIAEGADHVVAEMMKHM
ncbi:MAG: isoprenoid biosynthesis glyoxalase ElbB [Bacteroidales bacterium]|nr:isoprenoid biosynthesis glyoxalase ElbB [Bacteroidales bacterium]